MGWFGRKRKIEVGDKVKLKRGVYRHYSSWDWPGTGGFICEVVGIELGDGISWAHRFFFWNPSVVYICKHNQTTSAFVDSEIERRIR